MSYQNSSRTPSGKSTSTMSKRSPSILVTDSRSSKNRMSAPFAGHAAGLNRKLGIRSQPQQQQYSGYSSTHSGGNNKNGNNNKYKRRSSGRFSGISVDNMLQDSSDVPSGRREERGSNSSWDRFPVPEKLHATNYRKMINPLPSRTSRISQKLVLIPEETNSKGILREGILDRKRPLPDSRYSQAKFRSHGQFQNVSRLTAYNVAEGFNLKFLSRFLKEKHEVSPRLYDDCLYVAYILPLLPGKDGFRLKSNVSKKTVGGKSLIDKLIDNSEQRDHHYEYYSGVETLEDANNNYEITTNLIPEPEANVIPDHLPQQTNTNQDSFDPSEPQFFAEETPGEQEKREQEELSNLSSTHKPKQILSDEDDKHAEIFIFHYGVIVFWNFTEEQEKNLLGDITFAEDKSLVIRPLDEQDIETEEFHFGYDRDTERPRIFNDIITLRSGDHIIKLTLSYAIAQSSKLSRFESRISPILTAVTKLPKRLALYGTLGLKREQLLKKSGKLFKLRVDVNLSSSILDTPDFFWSTEPSLHPLYIAMREYLEIDKRVQVVNDRCKVFLEFFDICVDSVAERNIARVTWWFIIVIIIGVLFSLTEILVRYTIIHRHY